MNGKLFQRLCLLGCCTLGIACAGEITGNRFEVSLKDGNRYTGRLLAAAGGRVRLKPYWLDTPLQLSAHDIKTLQKIDPEVNHETGSYRLEFPSGSALTGTSVRSDADGFVVGTLWGGEIRIPRHSVKRLEFLDPSGLLYFGPAVQPPGQDQKMLQELILPHAGLQWQTEEILFSEKFLLEIQVLPDADDFVYHISLFDWRRRASGSVVFEITPDQISSAWYHRVTPSRLSVKNGRESIPESAGRQTLRYYVNLPEKKITLMLNGETVQTWSGEILDSFQVTEPASIGFRYLSGTGELSLQSIRLFHWNGDLPSGAEGGDEAVLQLKNGGRVQGILKQVDEKEVVLITGGEKETRRFPVGDVLEIRFPPTENFSEPVPPADASKLFFYEKAAPVDLNSISMEAGMLTGELWTGAEPVTLSIPLRSVHRLEFPAP